MSTSAVLVQIVVILVLLVANGIFALSEIAIVSVRKSRIQQQAESGDHRARRVLDLAENPNRFLSTVQIGITLIGIFAGAFGGATIAGAFEGWLEGFPPHRSVQRGDRPRYRRPRHHLPLPGHR